MQCTKVMNKIPHNRSNTYLSPTEIWWFFYALQYNVLSLQSDWRNAESMTLKYSAINTNTFLSTKDNSKLPEIQKFSQANVQLSSSKIKQKLIITFQAVVSERTFSPYNSHYFQNYSRLTDGNYDFLFKNNYPRQKTVIILRSTIKTWAAFSCDFNSIHYLQQPRD